MTSSNQETIEKVFSTKEVSEISGASLRQLQWWDETGRLEPEQRVGIGQTRFYSKAQVQKATRLKQLAEAGLSRRRWDFLASKPWKTIRQVEQPVVENGTLIVPQRKF